MHPIYQQLDDFISKKKQKELIISKQDLVELKSDPYLYAVFIKDLKLNNIKIFEQEDFTIKKTFFTKKKRVKQIDIPISGRNDLNNIISLPINSNIIFQGSMPILYKAVHIWGQVGLTFIEIFSENSHKPSSYAFREIYPVNSTEKLSIPLIKIEAHVRKNPVIKEHNSDIIFSEIQTLQFIKRKGLIAINQSKDLQKIDLSNFNQEYDFTVTDSGLINHKTKQTIRYKMQSGDHFRSIVSGFSFNLDDANIIIHQNHFKERIIQNQLLNNFPKNNRIIIVSNDSYYDNFFINYSNKIQQAKYEQLSIIKLIHNSDFQFKILDLYFKEEFSIELTQDHKAILLKSKSELDMLTQLKEILFSFTLFDFIIDDFFKIINESKFITNYQEKRIFIDKKEVFNNKIEHYLFFNYVAIDEPSNEIEFDDAKNKKPKSLIFFDIIEVTGKKCIDQFIMRYLLARNMSKSSKLVFTTNVEMSKNQFLDNYNGRQINSYFITNKNESGLIFESIDDIIEVTYPTHFIHNQEKINKLKRLGISDSDLFRLLYKN